VDEYGLHLGQAGLAPLARLTLRAVQRLEPLGLGGAGVAVLLGALEGALAGSAVRAVFPALGDLSEQPVGQVTRADGVGLELGLADRVASQVRLLDRVVADVVRVDHSGGGGAPRAETDDDKRADRDRCDPRTKNLAHR
jgi:hypothetical protein